MSEITYNQVERLVDALERFVNLEDRVVTLLEDRARTDEALVAKWQRDNELRAEEAEQRRREYERLDRWREEDLAIMERNKAEAREEREREYERLWGRKPTE